MDQLADLLLDRGDDLGMAMASRANGDAGVTVEKDVSVRVGDPNAACRVGNKFVIRPRIAWRDVKCVSVDDFSGFWSRQFCFNDRSL